MSRGEKLMVKSPNRNAYDDYLTQAGSSKVNMLSRVNSTSNTVPTQLKQSAAFVYGVASARKEYKQRLGSAQLNQVMSNILIDESQSIDLPLNQMSFARGDGAKTSEPASRRRIILNIK